MEDFVIVGYQSEFLPGNAKDTNGNEFKVSAMSMSKWIEMAKKKETAASTRLNL